MYVVDSTLLQVKGVVERKMKERELNRNSRGADGGVAQDVRQEVNRSSPLDRGVTGGWQIVSEEREVSDQQLRAEEGSNRLKMVEKYELMQRYARAGLWSDVESTAAQVAVVWRAMTRRGGEGTVDKMLVRVRFESRWVVWTVVDG